MAIDVNPPIHAPPVRGQTTRTDVPADRHLGYTELGSSLLQGDQIDHFGLNLTPPPRVRVSDHVRPSKIAYDHLDDPIPGNGV